LMAVLAFSVTILTIGQTGCASGGFKLTRKYARFVNSQNIIIRIVLYLLTAVVFAVTLLVDSVIFNTMDFWEGRVSASEYEFQENNRIYAVKHSYEGEKRLRKTVIQVFSGVEKTIAPESVVVLSETEAGKVQLLENGELKATVESIYDLPKIVLYKNGEPLAANSSFVIAEGS